MRDGDPIANSPPLDSSFFSFRRSPLVGAQSLESPHHHELKGESGWLCRLRRGVSSLSEVMEPNPETGNSGFGIWSAKARLD